MVLGEDTSLQLSHIVTVFPIQFKVSRTVVVLPIPDVSYIPGLGDAPFPPRDFFPSTFPVLYTPILVRARLLLYFRAPFESFPLPLFLLFC